MVKRGLRLPSLEKAVALAAQLTVFDQETATFVPFILNEEQLEILRVALVTRRLVVGKGRQIGCSTVIVYLLMLIAVMNPGVPICIIGHDQDTADGLLATVKHWLEEMGVELVVGNTRTLVLENGAKIVAKTAITRAGGDDEHKSKQATAGRSKTFAVVYATELAFWLNARAVWAALTGTATSNQILFADSTGAPGATLYREILEGAAEVGSTSDPSAWVRLFFAFETHANYRRDPSTLDDATWAQMQREYKFTRRDSAAWWWWKLTTDIKDVFRMLREYPVTIAQMFLFQEGQHIRKWVEVAVRREGWWNYYVDKFTEPIVLGVDTAIGAGKHGEPFGDGDASAIFVLGHDTGKPLATYRCNVVDIPAFIVVVGAAIDRFKPIATLVESNGVGAGVWQALRAKRNVIEQWSSADSRHSGELHVRRGRFRDAVEAGLVPIGGDLLTEARSSTVTTRGFEGHDDLISAGSFAWMWREKNPYKPPPALVDRLAVFVAPEFTKKRRRF